MSKIGNKNSVGNKGGRRPPIYTPRLLKQVARACQLGFTNAEIAELLGVAEATITDWSHIYPDLRETLKREKEKFDSGEIQQALRKRALGFKRTVEKPFKDGVVACLEELPPDTTACIFWLKNRQPDRWRDKQELEHSGDSSVVVNLNTKVK